MLTMAILIKHMQFIGDEYQQKYNDAKADNDHEKYRLYILPVMSDMPIDLMLLRSWKLFILVVGRFSEVYLAAILLHS
jgi:hypothetical protein